MSTSSQETHDEGPKVSYSSLKCGTEQGAASSKKRKLGDATGTDAACTAEDEQHSCQSAFQHSCCIPTQQQQPQQQQQQQQQLPQHVRKPAPVNTTHALQMLLNAAQTHEQMHQSSKPQKHHTEVDGPSNLQINAGQQPLQQQPAGGLVHQAKQTAFDAEHRTQPALNKAPEHSQFAFQPTQNKPRHSVLQAANPVNAMYAPTKPSGKVSMQLIREIQRLQLPEMDSDSVQAALEFTDAVQLGPDNVLSSEHSALLHTLEVGLGRLEVLRILTHRLQNSTGQDLSNVTGSFILTMSCWPSQ